MPMHCSDDLKENGTNTKSITISVTSYAGIKNSPLLIIIIIIIMLKPDEKCNF